MMEASGVAVARQYARAGDPRQREHRHRSDRDDERQHAYGHGPSVAKRGERDELPTPRSQFNKAGFSSRLFPSLTSQIERSIAA